MALRAFRLRLTMRPRVPPAAHSGRPTWAPLRVCRVRIPEKPLTGATVGDALIGVPRAFLAQQVPTNGRCRLVARTDR